MKKNRMLKLIRLGENDSVYFQFKGSSRLLEARALDVKLSDQGDIMGLLLDRLIHQSHETHFDVTPMVGCVESSYKVSGCYVTELSR